MKAQQPLPSITGSTARAAIAAAAILGLAPSPAPAQDVFPPNPPRQIYAEDSSSASVPSLPSGMTKVDWTGAQGRYVFSASDHVGGHGGFFQWQYTVDEGFKFVRDLNAMTDPVILPEVATAVASFK